MNITAEQRFWTIEDFIRLVCSTVFQMPKPQSLRNAMNCSHITMPIAIQEKHDGRPHHDRRHTCPASHRRATRTSAMAVAIGGLPDGTTTMDHQPWTIRTMRPCNPTMHPPTMTNPTMYPPSIHHPTMHPPNYNPTHATLRRQAPTATIQQTTPPPQQRAMVTLGEGPTGDFEAAYPGIATFPPLS
jgi:hypothetical protein